MNSILAIKNIIIESLSQAMEKARQEGQIPALSVDISIEHPQKTNYGDYATSLPLRLAKATGKRPMELAQILASYIETGSGISKVSVAPPGFINFTFSKEWLCSLVKTILTEAGSYGNINMGGGSRVQIEFVSANPTGPIHIGHGRGAVLGSTLSNILKAAGYYVEEEFYINDAGSQIDAFKRTLFARYQQALGKDAAVPQDGYHGQYMVDLAAEMVTKYGDKYLQMPADIAQNDLGEIGMARMLCLISDDLKALKVDFDIWFSERSLYSGGQYKTAMDILSGNNYIAERDNATWFSSTLLGDSKDNVIVRSDGTPTYFASDIAYHYNKFIERKFDRVINIWGADHQGHVSRMKAMVSALGINPERLTTLLFQMITLKRGGELVRLSKRTGEIISLREVIEEVGADACRFFFLARSTESQMDFDLELAKKESAENPVYYVQYAHARICSILHLAAEKQLDYSTGDTDLLGEEAELELIRKMAELPEIVETVSRTLEPHHLTYYAQELANAFHQFYKDCRVISDNAELTCARLKLVDASRIVLARTLHLMGMTSPESM
ncbi:arginine--tRNA ligase [Dehalococcoides mccartyi]|uniref:Arginine--tRNA ligase n=2 Tax=Dehalococcoides mccartyi TaxID=61435 RepID=SYR_DEHMC|nr:arginine--tRNA ligase [Dehalococcoides mccartyi]Q3ZYF0.1 RecName: Full=Arginine--tRNA ligase; AltName: Full=Arginyl-tRNA synthetase; Short=ArgRS [Dehalococcoides mccartyi CBDB1]CAI83277.1 arginyl-tRNA synthetase [Dehalococcoides mccartyi CBDB1]